MRLIKKIHLNRFLLLSTALTVPLLLSFRAEATTITISGKKLISTLNGGLSNGINDTRTYKFSSSTWNGGANVGNITGIAPSPTITAYDDSLIAATLPSGIYQNGENRENGYGIYIGALNVNEKPIFDFETNNAGVIWDYSSYISALNDNVSVVLKNGEEVFKSEIGGDIDISNGIFNGKIDIRKGNVQETFKIQTQPQNGDPTYSEFDVESRGNINISGGDFYFSKTNAQILMYKKNNGNINISGGNWYVGYNSNGTPLTNISATVQHENMEKGTITITGGQYHIASGNTLTFSAYTGSLSNPNSIFQIDGAGTLKLAFASFDINTKVDWDTGTLIHAGGTLTIKSDVTVDTYKTANGVEPQKLIIDGSLSVKNNLNLQSADLSGKGTLILDDAANATMGPLSNFGKISLKRGMLTFSRGSGDTLALSVLEGTNGLPGQQIGIILNNANTRIGTINLGNAALVINEQLIVGTLNFDNGQVIFNTTDKSLTLTGTSTIWNTSTIKTDGDAFNLSYDTYGNPPTTQTEEVTPKPGILTIKDGMTLTFADKEGTDTSLYNFSSPKLTINVENGASAVFNSDRVSFNNLEMTNGSSEVQKGIVTVLDTVTLENGGHLTIDSGAQMTATTVLAKIGSEINILENGILSVGTLTINGSQGAWSTLKGAGTLEVTGTATFQGRIMNLGSLTVNGGTVNFNGQTGYPDTIGTMTVEGNGTAILNHGTLTLVSLTLTNGNINLAGEDAILALNQNPLDNENIHGTISGIGSLELLNDTSISFGGGAAYLGGLRIGEGTATIEADTVLGSVTFTSTIGGTLTINEGATLTISDEGGGCSRSDHCRIITNSQNIVQGNALHLVDGSGSTFNGRVTLDELIFSGTGNAANSIITFGYSGTSMISTFDVDEATIIVNNGTLQIENDFGELDTFVYGTGTLFLQGNGSLKNSGTQSLTNLKIGSGTVNVGGGNFVNILFDGVEAGTLNLTGNTTVTNNIVVNAGNTVQSTGAYTLTLSGAGAIGSFSSSLSGLRYLTLQNGATAYINTSTQVSDTAEEGLILGSNSTLNIASDAVLTVSNTNAFSDSSATVTGNGTLLFENSGDKTVNARLNNLNTLQSNNNTVTVTNAANVNNVVVNGGQLNFNAGSTVGTASVNNTATLSFNVPSVVGTASVATNATMNIFGGSIISADVSGTLAVKDDTSIENVSFGNTDGTLNIATGKTLSVTNNIAVGAANTLAGDGTLFLSGTATGSFAMATNFDGEIKIGKGTANIQTNAGIHKISFKDGNGGVLSIADGHILTVGTISTTGANRITGAGTLKLTDNAVSTFGAPIDDLGELIVTGGATAEFNNAHILISQLTFANGGGGVNIATGVMTIQNLVQQDGVHIGSVYGAGSFVAGSGDIALSTGGNNLASATIGTGILNFVADSVIGTLKYSSTEGTINISNGVTVTVGSDFSGIGKLTGHETAILQLTGSAGATFKKANEYAGTIIAGSGNLTFLTDTDFQNLTLNGTTVLFDRTAAIDGMIMNSGTATFRQTANIGTVTVSQGNVRFKDTATLGALNIGSGKVFFSKDSSATNGSVSVGGNLNVDVNTLTVNAGNFAFNNNSTFSIRIARTATDALGNVNASGYGRLVMNGGTLNIGTNVNLDITIDYGLQTAAAGSVFKLVDGNHTGYFTFSNNRYSLTEEACSVGTGICYRLVQTSTAGQYAQEESGNQNQVSTASAFLDGELFDYGTGAYMVAEHLDAMSQNGTSREYLNALTALAPDVTNAMSQSPITLQSKISDTLSARMNGLQGHLGTASRTYRDIQKIYGRSGGSPYRTRFMRSSDYYRRAGYYDQDDQPVTKPRPAYQRRVEPGSREEIDAMTERKRWAKRKPSYNGPKDFGLWAQTFYNMSEYLSTNKPDGFSSDTTGFALGADMQVFDVVALGIGYASTSSSIDTLQRSTDVDGSSFFLYGMYKPADWFFSSVLNMASMTYKERKNIGGITIGDEYKGSSFGASFMVGKELKVWTPAVGIRYVSSSRKAHKDEIGQDISGISTSVTSLVAEGRMNRDLAKSETSTWHGELSAALVYDLSTSSEDAFVKLPNGSSYTVQGDDFSTMGVELGGTLSWLYGDHVDISAGYNLEWRQDYLSHTLTATFRWTF